MSTFIYIFEDTKEKCPLMGLEEFVTHRGRCYKFSSGLKEYREARKACLDLSTNSTKIDLVSIRDAEENKFITALRTPSFYNFRGWEAWIGIRKGDALWEEYQLSGKWVDGLKLSTWANWADNEPSPSNVSYDRLL